ncbi:receiver box response regulator [Natronomonas moolapensis 8.8.11]|uniref:Receiver box response regulator n=1 Tax=Natronomonas moolapensis (strain DSM 18674 / CECT 7526 / JCM 14361 / 8.8.11) TaxID=268739 RepID=M1XSI7_NATM8|nr:response regulator [Natronomonas moolapensis]CCQ37300.1 receiver box response regulator [Natronomonas moolapensis 8.8.11]
MAAANVVVAEDDAGIRDLVGVTLESAGHTVESFGAGDDCWERLETGDPPDLVILDVSMPGLDGAGVLDRIRSDTRLCSLPVVFLSGHDRDSDIVSDIEGRIEDYVHKPFSPGDLNDCVARLV